VKYCTLYQYPYSSLKPSSECTLFVYLCCSRCRTKFHVTEFSLSSRIEISSCYKRHQRRSLYLTLFLVQGFRKILNLLDTKLNGWHSSSMIYEHAIFGPSVRLRVTVKVTYKTWTMTFFSISWLWGIKTKMIKCRTVISLCVVFFFPFVELANC